MNRLLNRNALLGAVSSLVGGTLLLSTFRQAKGAFTLPGDIPAFLVPQAFLTMWIALSLAIFVSGLRDQSQPATKRDLGTTLAIAVLLIAATWLLRAMGFMIVAPIAGFLTGWLLGFRRHLMNAVVSLLTSGALYLVLTQFAELPLPTVPGFW